MQLSAFLQADRSVAHYFSCFRIIVLTTPDTISSKKADKFISGLKSKIQFEIRKGNLQELEEATKVAMCVEAAFCRISLPSPSGSASSPPDAATSPSSMGIGNAQVKNTTRGSNASKIFETMRASNAIKRAADHGNIIRVEMQHRFQ